MPLVDKEIKAIGPSVISPFDEKLVNPSSIDIRLNGRGLAYVRSNKGIIDPTDKESYHTHLFHIGENETFRLDPNAFVIASSIESVNIPSYMSATLCGKSSLARLGLLIHVTAGWIDPGFKGHLILEIKNVGPLPIVLTPNMRIAQLVFEKHSDCEQPYAGRYQGQYPGQGSLYWMPQPISKQEYVDLGSIKDEELKGQLKKELEELVGQLSEQPKAPMKGEGLRAMDKVIVTVRQTDSSIDHSFEQFSKEALEDMEKLISEGNVPLTVEFSGDPVGQVLSSIDKDIEEHPETVTEVSQEQMDEVKELVKDVEVSDEDLEEGISVEEIESQIQEQGFNSSVFKSGGLTGAIEAIRSETIENPEKLAKDILEVSISPTAQDFDYPEIEVQPEDTRIVGKQDFPPFWADKILTEEEQEENNNGSDQN